MSVIAIQAEAGPRKVADPPPELSRELRRHPGQRAERPRASCAASSACCAAAARTPRPSPASPELAGLLDSARSGGVRVAFRPSAARARALPQGVDLSAYRILQEALSNVDAAFPPATPCGSSSPTRPAPVVIKVRNDAGPAGVAADRGRMTHRALRVRQGTASIPATWPGPARAPVRACIGMRERTTMLGGHLDAAPTDDGGFLVTAVLPDTRGPRAARPVTVRVVIADDQGMVRSGFTTLLNSEPDIEVVGEAVNGREAVARAVAAPSPALILMDVRMPVMDGLQATRQITALGATPKVLVRPPSTWTTTSTRRCGGERAGSCSRTPRPANSPTRSGSSRPAMCCCHPE